MNMFDADTYSELFEHKAHSSEALGYLACKKAGISVEETQDV